MPLATDCVLLAVAWVAVCAWWQAENWAKRVEMREQREEELTNGLALYK